MDKESALVQPRRHPRVNPGIKSGDAHDDRVDQIDPGTAIVVEGEQLRIRGTCGAVDR
jgi:hypothetical protein